MIAFYAVKITIIGSPKLKFRVFLASNTVAMIAFYAIKITIIGSPMTGHVSDTNIVVSIDKHR